MAGWVLRWLSAVRTRLRQRLDLLLECVLHHQLAVLQRTGTRRPCFRPSERLFWMFLSRWWANWQRSLIIVKPATVLRWRRRGSWAIWRDTVACETSNPSFSSSPWIRGAPHKKFSWLIRTISARTSLLILGRPPRQRPHEPGAQIAHKPRRRQRKTVAGWMMIRLRCQLAHHRDRNTQNSRSLVRKHGRRVPVRCSTAS